MRHAIDNVFTFQMGKLVTFAAFFYNSPKPAGAGAEDNSSGSLFTPAPEQQFRTDSHSFYTLPFNLTNVSLFGGGRMVC